MKEYTAHVSFAINCQAQSRTAARINLLNKLQFPGHMVANLIVTIKDDEDDCNECGYVICVCKPVINEDLPDDK